MRSIHRFASATTALALASAGLLLTTGSAHAAATCSQSRLPLPDAGCTPGAYNPDVTQSTINSTICVPGWTKTVRPPASYTNQLKIKQIGEYGYSDTNTADYEEDHLVPLELGGAPRDPKNLWPEPRYGDQPAASKDSVENKLKVAVCNGQVQLDDARSAIATDWTTALSKVGIG
ncbi:MULTISPECIES: hypothetical protein [unclassified Streptomyces]|uniref:hypothetical protein n=1 Tax=unclassified Streptomyces TaxID=2593676 RepID=UPI001319B62B|nr:hypothetical protein [Streptomyces sp. GS7]QHC23105.1 hypothetical protein GR130_18510 [Streptomyces sp. GS7]